MNDSFDLVIATPTHSFYIANYVAKKHSIPLVLRVWGVRPNKLIDNIIYGKKYSESLLLFPSILNNIFQVYSSQKIVALDDSTARFLRRFMMGREVLTIYPTYSAVYEGKSVSPEISEICKDEELVMGVVSTLKRWHDRLLFLILRLIAKKNPDIKVVIVGGSISEVREFFRSLYIPGNMVFVRANDLELKLLYGAAKLVIIPFFFKSVSNRLLESLYYGKPTLTNTFAKIVFNRLQHLHHVFISDRIDEYPGIVRNLMKDDLLLERLSLGARTAYKRFFSSKLTGLYMKQVIEQLLT